MNRPILRVVAGLCVLGLAACGENNLEGTGAAISTPTSTLTPTVEAPTTPTVEAATSTPTRNTTNSDVTHTATPTGTVPPVTLTPTRTATVNSTPVPSFTATASATATPAIGTAQFTFDVSNPLNTFPSDRLRDATGHTQVPAAYLRADLPNTDEFQTARDFADLAASQATALTGFGTFAPIRVRFDRSMVVDNGLNPRGIFVLEYNDLSARPALITASAYEPEMSIEIQPVYPLKPKTTYAVVLTNALVDADGNPAQPSADFAQLLAGTGLSAVDAAWAAHLQPVIDFMNSAYGITKDMLVVVDAFTTEPTTDDLIAIQHRLVGASRDLVPGPPQIGPPLGNLETGIFLENTPEYTDLIGAPTSNSVAAVVIGWFDSYDFRVGPNKGFDPGKVNGPTIPGVNHVDFYMTLPKAPKPPNGYPLVVFGHGLGGSGRDVARIAQLDNAPPVIAMAISALQHGRRGNVTNFFVLNDISATREFFRQTVADFMQEVRMAENAHTAGTAPFDQIDPTNIQYLGGSLGGIMGTLFMAVEPDIKVGLLSVPGGGLTNILESPDIGGLLQPLLSLTVGIPVGSPFFPQFIHRFQAFSQWTLESADPIDYAPYMIVPGNQLPGVPIKRILMHEGIVDSTVPNRTTDDLAFAMRLPDLNATSGCMNPDGCNGIWRFVMTDYGQEPHSGHTVTITVPQATQQAFQYLLSNGTVVTDAHP